jgi:MoaA/NifB/PqqE/SkfB family radical SAM enzyme
VRYDVNPKDYYYGLGKEIFVVFGTGDVGQSCQYFLQKNNIDIAFFIDVKTDSWFSEIAGKLILPLAILDQLPIEKTFVFIAADNEDVMAQFVQLLEEKSYKHQDYCNIDRKYMDTVNKMQATTIETRNYVKSFHLNECPTFRLLEIELINRCNGKCEFCVVNTKNDTRPYAKMSDELFYSIIAQLKELDYTGRISLHSNSEPLLDSRLVEFARHIHQELPHAVSITITNGTLLTLEIFKELIEYLDVLCINNYSNDYEFNATTKQIYKYCIQHPRISKKVHIQKRLYSEVLHTRGGTSPNAESCVVYGHICSYPFSQMIIRPDGKLSFCCADALAQMTLGDLTKQSILEAWNSDAYVKVRELALMGSEHLSLCSVCSNSAPLLPEQDPNNKLYNDGSLLGIGKVY